MSAPPVWLLDIDGVVNAIAPEPPDAWSADRWVRAEAACAGAMWPLLAARPVLNFIRRVHRDGRAEIRWHTTWRDDASAVARALDLPDFPVQPAPEFDQRAGQVGGTAPVGATWWKLPAAQRVVDTGRSLLWTDDDAAVQLENQLFRSPRVLVISPRTAVGLTPADLRAVDTFLPRPRTAPAPPTQPGSSAQPAIAGTVA